MARGTALPDVGVSPDVDKVAFSLQSGAVSDPINTSNGTVIVRVAQREETTPDAFKQAKETFRTELLNERRDRFFSAYMNKAKESMKIQVNTDVARRALGI